jgi:polyisoprenoid-binding protein YceI
MSSEAAVSDTAFTGTSVTVDKEQSTLTFVGGSSVIDHEGSFEDFDVVITPSATDPADFTQAQVAVTIDTTSITSDSEMLTGHLNKEDFFDTTNYPTATFTSTSIDSAGDNMYKITGDLVLKGQTKTATFDATVTDDGMTVHYDLPRKDFGIGNDSYGDKLLDETVPVDGTIVFVK